MKSILITGFEPFNGQNINPASELLPLVANLQLNGACIHCHTLPVVGAASHAKLMGYIEQYQADIVLVLGQAAGRDKLTLERVAINLDDYPIADNAGELLLEQPIVADGPAAYFTTLPIKAMVQSMLKAQIPAAISNTAGTFVCNHIFYRTLHSLQAAEGGREVKMGFMHLPLLPEQSLQGKQPSMDLAEQLKGVKAALMAVLEPNEQFAKIVTGVEC